MASGGTGGKSEEVLLQVNHVRYQRVDGTLYLLTERLAWAPSVKQNITLSLKYADMKQQKISPDSKEKVQMQIVMTADAASHVFQFVCSKGRDSQLEARSQVVEMLQPLIQKFQRKITSEIENKNRVLASNPAFFQLYKDLVVSGIVTPEEFWATHAKELEDNASSNAPSSKTSTETPTDSQRMGIQAGFLANLRPQTDEESGGIRYNLTADTIEAIFRTYPSVKLKHAEYVPHSMSESDFWSHFFQSHYFHRDRLETGKNLFSGDQVSTADTQTIASLLENDPFVNVSGFVDSDSTIAAMTVDSIGGDEGSSTGGKGPSRPPPTGKITPAHINRLIVQRMNYHSERVLSAQVEEEPGAGPLSRSLPKKDLSERVLIGDLMINGGENAGEAASSLDIANAEAYSFCATYEPTERFAPPEDVEGVIDMFRAQLSSYQPAPHSAFEADEEGQFVEIFSEMTAPTSSDSAHGVVNFASACGGSYSSALESEYRGFYAALGELLRHFWTCFPVTNAQLEQKLVRMRETLATFRGSKLKSFEQRLAASGVQSTASVTGHLHVMLDTAQRKYDTWQARKGGARQ